MQACKSCDVSFDDDDDYHSHLFHNHHYDYAT